MDFRIDVNHSNEIKILQLTDMQIIDATQQRYEGRLTPSAIEKWIPEKNEIFQVMIGDGFNLSREDYEQGLDGYLYIKTYQYDDPDFEELDGGQLDYRSNEHTYDDDITTAVYDALEFHYGEVPYFIPLELFWH